MLATRRTILRSLAGPAALGSLAYLSSGPAWGAVFKMKMTTTATHDLDTEWLNFLKQNTERASGGRITGEIYPASQLGSAGATIEGVAMGAIEVAINASGVYEGLDGRFATLSVPGLIRSMSHGAKVLGDPEVRRRFAAIGKGKGYEVLTLLPHSPTAVVSRKPIRTLSDFKGMKIRVPGSKVLIEIMRRLGASPVSMSLGEVLPAFQTGAIDGIYLGSTIVTALKLHDMSKSMTLMPFSFISIVGLVSSEFLKTIGSELSGILLSAASEADVAGVAWGDGDIEASRNEWEKRGGETITLSAADAEQFVALAAPAAIAALSEDARADYEIMKAVSARHT